MMRAKMQVVSITKTEYGEELRFTAVAGKAPFGDEGESEDNTYARFTPTGSVAFAVTNPALYGKFTPGQKFYLDFTLAPE